LVKNLCLVIDDEPGILRFVKTGLSISGFDVIATTDGNEALEIARSGEPDIIILDLYMEPMSGFDFLKELRNFSLVPVVIITAYPEVIHMAMDLGANGYVKKPFTPADLVREINEVLVEYMKD
jgi:two-component system, OmpR family, KDP operon response regulator KdpE